jgi:hypothetical protein
MNDPLPLLLTIVRGITIPPEAGGPAISYKARIGWLDTNDRATAGELLPQFTISVMAASEIPHDANGLVRKSRRVYAINVWNQAYGTYETPANLNWKMVNQLLSVLTTSRVSADANTRYFEVIDPGTDKTDGTVSPPIRRMQVLVAAHGFR